MTTKEEIKDNAEEMKNIQEEEEKVVDEQLAEDKDLSPEERIEMLERELEEQKDKNLRIFAEFDNFRKRSARERIEFMKTAGRDIIQDLLPIIDDLERALQAMSEARGEEATQEGVKLLYHKFIRTLENKGLKPMDSLGKPFDAEWHEAITEIPAPSKKQKGQVMDVIEKGYLLNGVIIRFAKVVVGK